MRFAIAYSKLNSAGTLIAEKFKKLSFSPQIPIIELKKETIYSDDLNEKHYPELKNIEFLVFASTHKSEKGNPSLCLHAPGNWRSQKSCNDSLISDDSQNSSEKILKGAELGGKPGKICPTSAFVLKYLFQELNKNYNENKNKLNQEYNITLEVTHHGPDINIPCCFIELGSSEKEWNDKEAAKIIARTILALESFTNHIEHPDWIPAIGIGGLHYCPAFNKIQLNSNYALSHIIPEYVFPVTESMLKQAEEKTQEQIKEVIIDWKGCGNSESRQKLLDLLKHMSYKYRRTSEKSKNL